MIRDRLAGLWLALAVFVAPIAGAHVTAALVSPQTSIQPGREFTVALRMAHEPHWHSYWINAGTGYPTRLEWKLPGGWSAGEIQWPTPILIKDSHGAVTGHGYDGVVYLQVPITPAGSVKPGSSVTLNATASWLMCADVCIPATQEVSLTLPVSSDPPRFDAVVQSELAKMPMPREAGGWRFTAGRGAKAVVLNVAGTEEIHEPHFFSQDELIQYDSPQGVTLNGSRAILKLPLAEGARVPDRLIGVLAYTDAAGKYRGASVNVPLTANGAANGADDTRANADAGAGAAAPSASGATSAILSLRVIVLALVGGLILNLMPCVFPVIGIKILGFVNQAGGSRRGVTMHGLAFAAGVLLSFWALAALLAVLRRGGEQLGWGFQLQSPAFVFLLTAVMLVFAMSLSGVFEFGLRATGVGSNLPMKGGYSGSLLAGVLATVVATPCSAPFLAPALGAALSLPPAESFVVFTAIAVGLSAPYLLLSAFPRAVAVLPRPGRWMETFKQAMAFPLYATVGCLVWVLAGQTSESGLLAVLLSLAVIAMGVWLYGRYSGLATRTLTSKVAVAAALSLMCIGLYVGWPRTAQAGDIAWEAWSEERVAELQRDGRTIYVDFTARWCATCQANKKLVFASGQVRDTIRQRNVALLRADWTNSDPRITAELARWGRSAVPFNLVYLPGDPEPHVLPEILTPGIVLDALND